MPYLSPIQLSFPRSPENQVMHSLDRYDLDQIHNLKSQQKQGFVHIIQPEDNRPNKNIQILENWQRALIDHHYVIQKLPEYYFYRVKGKEGQFSGFLGGCSTADFTLGNITQHEHTYSNRVAHMAKYLSIVKIQAEPLVLIHEEEYDTSMNVEAITLYKPYIDFEFDGVWHQLWKLNQKESQILEAWSTAQLYFHLADGHHRLASLIHLAKTNKRPYNASCFLIHQSQFLLYSFIWYAKKGLDKMSENLLIQRIQLQGAIAIDFKKELKKQYNIVIKIRKCYYGFTKGIENPPVFIRQKILSVIPDFIKNLNYKADTSSEINSKQWKNFDLVFFMKPLAKNIFFEQAKKGKYLPAKSTYILPKLLTGLIVAPLE